MTVRQRIDQLAAEPPVSDLGYAADQRLVASALLGLQLLADEIDAIRAGIPATYQVPAAARADEAQDAEPADVAVISDIVDQLRDISEQVVQLTAAVKASAELPQLVRLSDQVADLTAAVRGTAKEEDDHTEEKAHEKRKKDKKEKKKKAEKKRDNKKRDNKKDTKSFTLE